MRDSPVSCITCLTRRNFMLIFPVMCRGVWSSLQTRDVHHWPTGPEKSVRVCLLFARILHVVLPRLPRQSTETQTSFRVDSNLINELAQASPLDRCRRSGTQPAACGQEPAFGTLG